MSKNDVSEVQVKHQKFFRFKSNILGCANKKVSCEESTEVRNGNTKQSNEPISPPRKSLCSNLSAESIAEFSESSEACRTTNLTLCCAITEATKVPSIFQCKNQSQKIKNRRPSMLQNQELSVTDRSKPNGENEITKVHRLSTSLELLDNESSRQIAKQPNGQDDSVNSLIKPSRRTDPTFSDKHKHLRRAVSTGALMQYSSLDDSIRREDSYELNSSLESLLRQSASNTKVMLPVPVEQAKRRNFLLGRSGANSLLGAAELERIFPNRVVTIFVATWNMNGEEPPRCLNDLFLPDKIETLPDVCVIGTQESHSETTEWEVSVQETLGPSHVLFHSETFGVLYIGVYIRRELIWYCSMPEDESYSLRPGSSFKTKGAVGICFYLFGTSFLFLTSHLTAHDDKLNDRIHDVKRITKSLELPKNLPPKMRSRDVTQRFDYVFWFGDLNFRITQPRKQVIDWLSKQKFPLDPLQTPLYDQLSSSMKKGLVFRGFHEAPITFFPTYKYDVGTDTLDTSHKERVPSYTDRILYKCKKPGSSLLHTSLTNSSNIECKAYTSVPSFRTSDHKPVWALFKCKLKPGFDTIPLAAGLFNRNVYRDALKRRAVQNRKGSNSNACRIQ